MTTSECAICERDRLNHRDAEKLGHINHKFSENGELVPLKSSQEPPPPAGPNMETPKDPVLRYLLIDKGLITPSELLAAEEKLRSTGFLVSSDGPPPSAGV